MKNILVDISGKLDNSYIETIKKIKKVADSLKIPFFLIGALSRDIIMEYFYQIKAPRLTNDIDMGIKVSGWNQYRKLINALELSGAVKKQQSKHGILYNDINIDIIPFGGVSDKNERISWPSENEIIMSVMGFNDVYNHSILARLQKNPALDIRIPTLPGLTILKLFSWNEGFPDRSKDAEDLLFIMNNYEKTEIIDNLFEQDLQILEKEDFDTQTAGIILLGREMVEICSEHTIKYLIKILEEETHENSNYNLIKDMLPFERSRFDRILYFLKKLKEGICYQKR